MDTYRKNTTDLEEKAEQRHGYSRKDNLDGGAQETTQERGFSRKKNNGGKNSSGTGYGGYQESDAVKQAQEMLQQQISQKPGAYQSPWQAQLSDTINRILNREKFSYDLNGDALYQQYKDQYINQGKLAMMDTMGQAAAMTGGYGNSYAQSVGQQAYQGYLQGLNDKIPELYQLALSKYQMEGDELYNQYSMLGAQEQQDYGRYRDTVSDWNTETDRLYNRYDTERNFDYSKFADNRDYQYQVSRDKVADEQWQAEFDEAVRQFNFANKLGEFAVAAPVYSGGDDGGSSGGSSSKKTAANATTANETGTTPIIVSPVDLMWKRNS